MMKAPQPYAEGIPSWADLATSDADAAREFYATLFGWDFDGVDSPQGIYYMATKGGNAVAGLSSISQEGMPPMWSTYISVENCDDCTAKAEAAGGAVLVPPTDVMDAGRMSFVQDPTGAVIGFWQRGRHDGAQVIDEPGAFTWVELFTTDKDAATTFYKEVVGLDSEDIDMGVGPYTTWKVGDRTVGGTMPPPMDGVPNHWHVYFGTSDADETADLAAASGGQVVAGPLDTPVGRMATIKDPQGATFSIIALNEWPEA